MNESRWNATGLIAVIGLVVVASLQLVKGSGSQPSAYSEPVGITVSGHYETKVSPDVAYVSLGVVTRNKSARQAAEENAEIAQRVMNSIAGQGINKKDIQTTEYSTQPWVKYTSNGDEKRLGYQVSNVVWVRVRDIRKISNVIDATTQAGANSVQSVKFGIADQQALKRKMLSAAVKNAQTKAEALAGSLDVSVGRPLSINEESGSGFSAMPASPVMGKLSPSKLYETPINPGQEELSQDVTVVFALR